MTVQLSPHRVSRILRGYFRGLPQAKIAREAAVDQSSVSHYATRFKEMAATYGISAAGKEYKVVNEVESLRSLSVELYKSKLTVEEARQGHNIIKAFLKLGVSPEGHLSLVGVCKEVEDPGFVEAALRLSQIEDETGMSYQQIISSFDKVQKQLPQLEGKIAKAQVEVESMNDTLLKNREELANQEKHLEEYKNEVKAKAVQLDKELLVKMKQVKVAKKEAEDIAALKADLAKKGLNLETVLRLAKEF
jgi:hypothetical protein